MPLLSVPLSRIAVSPLCADHDLRIFSGGDDPVQVRDDAIAGTLNGSGFVNIAVTLDRQ